MRSLGNSECNTFISFFNLRANHREDMRGKVTLVKGSKNMTSLIQDAVRKSLTSSNDILNGLWIKHTGRQNITIDKLAS